MMQNFSTAPGRRTSVPAKPPRPIIASAMKPLKGKKK